MLTGTPKQRYSLSLNGKGCKFQAPASTPGCAKLYTVADAGKLLYVGISSQRMSTRLSLGLRFTGAKREYLYKWRNLRHPLALSVWTAASEDAEATLQELEIVEAEVAFQCRSVSGQWPLFQNEIHFHQSGSSHRSAAARIYQHAVARQLPASSSALPLVVAA